MLWSSGNSTLSAGREHLLSHNIAYTEYCAYLAYLAYLAYGVSGMSRISNLDIYKSLMVFLWNYYAQHLAMCEIILVFFLLLLLFCDYPAFITPLYQTPIHYCEPLGPVTPKKVRRSRIETYR